MKAYSQDLRQRVLRAINQGKKQAEVVEMFAISTATIKRYLKARRERGHVLPQPIPGRPSIKGAALQAGLLDQLEAKSDATQILGVYFITHFPSYACFSRRRA